MLCFTCNCIHMYIVLTYVYYIHCTYIYTYIYTYIAAVLSNSKLTEELLAARATVEKLQKEVRDFVSSIQNMLYKIYQFI